MLVFQDILYTSLHVLVIGLNMLAWIPKKTRRLHLITLCLTGFSWLILGLHYGWGYCFLTDWHWRVKRKLGEWPLPDSFIHYQIVETFGLQISPGTTDQLTGWLFLILILIALWQHGISPRLRKHEV
jgi:hypothetical protein